MSVGGNDYILTSEAGDVLIQIPRSTPVNDLRYLIDNLPRLKESVERGLIDGMSQCGGRCGTWCHPWQEHDSGSGFGYNCTAKKDTLPGFDYWKYSNSINASHRDSHLKITLPDSKEREHKYIGQRWLNDWTNFERWLNNTIGQHQITISGDANKLTASEELELHRLLNKMNQ